MGDSCWSVATLKSQISSLRHLYPDPAQSQEDACPLDLLPSLADLCGASWALQLGSQFWAESNRAGAHGSLLLA